MLAARQPLVVPMLLRLSHFRLSSYVVLVVSKQKGITLVFKTDPLQHVDINSTFDSIAVIQEFIQREIEGQLRQMFREDLPGIIHRLSQQWVKSKVEAPYLNKQFPPPSSRPQPLETRSSPDLASTRLSAGADPQRHLGHPQSPGTPSMKRPRSIHGGSVASSSRRPSTSKSAKVPTPPDPQNEYESFDPTYGLRPEGLPTKSVFKGFSSLFLPNKGLADLTEEPSDEGEDEDFEDDGTSTAFDVVDWEDTISGVSPPPSVSERGNTPEYETIPAVGGGTITRPRILHSQSNVQPTPGMSPRLLPSNPHSRSQGSISSGLLSRQHSSGSYVPDIHTFNNALRATPSYYPSRPRTPDSIDSSTSGGANGHYPINFLSHQMRSPNPTNTHTQPHNLNPNTPISIRRPNSERRLSVSSSISRQSVTTTTSLLYSNTTDPTTLGTSPPNNTHLSYASDQNPKLNPRPSLTTNSIHHLSTLSQSYHTLSPYTRSLSHFTVRSVPPRGTSTGGSTGGHSGVGGVGGAVGERQPVKAKRKRIFRIGGKKSTEFPPTPIATGVPFSVHDDPFHPDFSPDRNGFDERTPEGRNRSQNLRQQHVGMPPEFDAEDMDRYFRSNEDLSVPQSSSSPLGLSPLQAVRQHLQQQHQGAEILGIPSPVGSAKRRQALSTSSQLR